MILLDTGFLYAFLNSRDAQHAPATQTMAAVVAGRWGQPCVSELVVAELFNLIRARRAGPLIENNAAVLLFGPDAALRGFRAFPAPSVVAAGPVLALYKRHGGLSFTDAALLDASRQHSCPIATFDSGFEGLCEIVS